MPMPKKKRSRLFARIGVVAALSFAVPALAQQPVVVHEFIPFDPTAESELGVVTTEGGFDVEKITTSGKITAPDPGRPITEKTPLYSNKATVPEKYSPDRDTRRVDHLPYDDPFRPRLAPFKRLVAFDAVESDYTLKTASALHSKVNVGAEKLRNGRPDVFYADVAVDLVAGESIRIPSAVGGNVIKKAHLNPAVSFKLERDGAENLFIVADGGGRARLIMELEAPREAFGEAERQPSWGELLTAMTTKLPGNVQKAADEFARELKIDKSVMAPHEAVRTMVRYFREFKESEDPPPNTGDVYLDLVRNKKGVCRHRAFGFMITALGLGIPARFVSNEAHAWVEQWDGIYWRRIDLGGAGRILDDKTERLEKPQPAYDPPLDPYTWPAGATKGSDLIPPSAPAPAPTSTGGSSPTPVPVPTGSSSAATPSTAPPSKVTLVLPGASSEGDLEIFRTRAFMVRGRIVDSTGAPCKALRVEIVLSGAKEVNIRVLTTDSDGNYEAEIAIPLTVDAGEYSITAHTPGHGTCGQGKSE
jgi:transglutaminase-like putative cysteine protease